MATSELVSAPVAAEYTAALDGVAWYDGSAGGRLRLTGRDRADLLHRLSTNDIRQIAPGSGARTVVVNHNARIIDLLTVYALPEHLLVTTSPGQHAAVINLLRRNIFFQDRVVVEDLTGTTVAYHLYGPQAASFVAGICTVDPRDWPLHHIQAVEIAGAQGWLARTLPIGGDGFIIFGRAEDREALEGVLAPVPRLSEATYDVLRVEQGYGAFGHELSLEYIPLETRLTDAVSFTKGCYVGQEIIARMESRNRLAKQLMGLRLPRAVPAGGKLTRDGKEMGDLTSVVESPRFGTIALAYVRTAAAEPDSRLEVGEGVVAEVVELPFTAA
jgi:tRNA-modifying protein YgfZ